MKRRTVLAGLGATAAAGALGMPSILEAQAPITLNGAVQFNDDHAFTKALIRFEELVKKYYGKPVNFTLHKNSSLGLEKQYFEYMSQEPLAKSVDLHPVQFAIISIVSLAFGLVTPPYGTCLLVACAIAGVQLRYALKDTIIMLIPMLLALAAVIIWPDVSLFLRG